MGSHDGDDQHQEHQQNEHQQHEQEQGDRQPLVEHDQLDHGHADSSHQQGGEEEERNGGGRTPNRSDVNSPVAPVIQQQVQQEGLLENMGLDLDRAREILVRELRQELHNLKTPLFAWTAFLANFAMIVLVFVIPIACNIPSVEDSDKDDPDPKPHNICSAEPLSIFTYMHAINWFIHLVADQYLKQRHKKSRVNGYVEFYLDTKNTRRTPFYIISIGNAALLVTGAALGDYYQNADDKIVEIDTLRALVCLEAMIIMAVWGRYLRYVHRFHKEKNLPDVLRADARRRLMLCNDPPPEEGQGENGQGGNAAEEESQSQVLAALLDGDRIRSPSDIRDEILERQAELLRYLHAHVEVQNDRILEMVQERTELYRRVDNLQAAVERAEESAANRVAARVVSSAHGDDVEQVVTHRA